MPGASLALFADLGACHVQKSSVTICVLPAPFRWKATGTGMSMQTAVQISIHALRVEGDHLPLSFLHTVLYFYPRPPGGGRLGELGDKLLAVVFLSTPSGWRATSLFSPTPTPIGPFLSTPSGWRATCACPAAVEAVLAISIHALRVEGDADRLVRRRGLVISIHALRVEGDLGFTTAMHLYGISIHALRVEGDYIQPGALGCARISIHALRVEGDTQRNRRPRGRTHFYPRPPGGGRPKRRLRACRISVFLSTPSGWRAT